MAVKFFCVGEILRKENKMDVTSDFEEEISRLKDKSALF
jgi:hypothetical protein